MGFREVVRVLVSPTPFTESCVLSACPVALEQKRYTWRHYSVPSYIVNCKFWIHNFHSETPGHTAPGGGSIPPELCVTVQKPDIVIIEKEKRKFTNLSLHAPVRPILNTGIQRRRKKLCTLHHRLHRIQVHCFLFRGVH